MCNYLLGLEVLYTFFQMQSVWSLGQLGSFPGSTGEAWTQGEFWLLIFAVVKEDEGWESWAPLRDEVEL